MNIEIWDYLGEHQYVNWAGNQFTNLTYTHEMPGGMISAAFDVPIIYNQPYDWCDADNKVRIKHNSVTVWSGHLYAPERFWADTSVIKIDCVGDVTKFADNNEFSQKGYTTNLSNEKGSTYITDHILSDPEIAKWITAGTVNTGDYTIPGERDYQPFKSFREVLDDIYSFNDGSFDWYVWNGKFYWAPKETLVSYITNTSKATGSVRQEKSEFANKVVYSYRDLAGAITAGSVTDTDSPRPLKVWPESYSDNMTAAQALQRATESLNTHNILGATATVTVTEAWNVNGSSVDITEIRPGKIIRIGGLVAGKASISEVYTENDIDAWPIKSIKYTHEPQSIEISPGRIPYTMPVILSRMQ